MKRLLSVLFWGIIAAAFIGPGTVTTAASAGAAYGYRLLWALLFSTLACLVLQEAAARLTAVSGLTLGEALRLRFARGEGAVGRAGRAGWAGPLVIGVVLVAIVFGCAAYEAGNILGAVAGVTLFLGGPAWVWTLFFAAAGAALLAFGSTRVVALTLSLFVALMGIAFLVTAILLRPNLGELLHGAFVPSVPASPAGVGTAAGAGLLVLGLVGTTVVPYNLFLGSGLARTSKSSDLGTLRFGLGVAVLFGGLISMGVLVVGAAVAGEFSFAALGDVLAERLGGWARVFFGVGLTAAGLSSAITAPLAAALTARGLSDDPAGEGAWSERGWRYRVVWGGVLATGVVFGASGIKPIPAILLAQAANGVLLPLVAVFLLLAVNDRRLLGSALNTTAGNFLAIPVVFVTLVLGLTGLAKAASWVLERPLPSEAWLLGAASIVALLLSLPVGRALVRGWK